MIKYHPNVPKPGQPNSYAVVYENGCVIGHLEQEVDGYYYFWPISQGFWDQRTLMDIGRKLEALNEAWNQKVHEMTSPVNNDIQRPEDN